MRSVNLIVVHCSASPNGARLTAAEIDGWHKARGFKRLDAFRARQNPSLGSIGYHFVLRVNGAIETGRHLDEVGAHVMGNNKTSIGVCMVGLDRFTPIQWERLAANIGGLLRTYPNARVCGHRDLSPDQDNDGLVEPWEWLKICPGFSVADWLANAMQPLPAHVLESNDRQPDRST